MSRRVERLLPRRRRPVRRVPARRRSWSGTFHSVGARLLREYAGRIGLDPAFTIHDRQDSADLMNLVRHELGFCRSRASAFPLKATCLAIYSARSTPARPCARCCRQLSLVRRMGKRSEAAVSRLRRSQAGAAGARLRRPAALLGADGQRSRARPGSRRALQPRAGRRVPGHQPPAGSDPAGHEARRPRPHRGRRRRAVDLRFRGADGAQHPRFPGALRPARAAGDAGAQLPLDAADPGRRQPGHRLAASASARTCGASARRRKKPRWSRCATRPTRPTMSSSRSSPDARPASRLKAAGGAVPNRAAQRAPGTRADPAQHPFRQVRRPQVSRSGARQGRAGRAALGPEPARPVAGFRAMQLVAGIGPKTAGRVLDNVRPRPPAVPCSPNSRSPKARGRWLEFAALVDATAALHRPGRPPSQICALVRGADGPPA
jgi:DNA helicase-2/ATP-dependent DNA helicase PcrA